MKNVLIGAGHRNKQSGNQYEAAMNGRKCRAIMDLFAAQGGKDHFGFDLRCYTPDNGLGWSPLDLNEVPVTGFQDKNWPVDLMVELHSEGSGRQGAFVIFPDWSPDVDVDVRRHGKVFVDALDEATGMGYRVLPAPGGVGLMSEKQTGVGLQGYRLGVFRDTAQFKARTSRMIFEQGAHDVAEDLEVMNGPSYLHLQAVAFMDGVSRFFAALAPTTPEPEPVKEYADPVALPFILGRDFGIGYALDGCPVTLFKTEVEALTSVVPRAWARGNAPVTGESIPTRTRFMVYGDVQVPVDPNEPTKTRQWFFLEDGSRIQARHVSPSIKVRKR